MSIFSTRLRELRASRKITQKQAAKETGISERAYQHYELDTLEPSIGNAGKLADFYNVSLDYLTGRSNNPQRQ